LMAVGLMMLPAAAARFWVRELWSLSAYEQCVGARLGLFSACCCPITSACPQGRRSSWYAGLGYLASVASARATACARFIFGARILRHEPSALVGKNSAILPPPAPLSNKSIIQSTFCTIDSAQKPKPIAYPRTR
jgi:hypothetical protein